MQLDNFFPNFETKYNRTHKHFVLAKFDAREMQGKILGKLKESKYLLFYTI